MSTVATGDIERTRWFPITLLVLCGIAAAVMFSKVSVSFAAITEHYRVSETVTAWLISAPAVVGIVFGLTASVVAARLGFRRVLIVCLIVATFLALAQSSLLPLPLFFVSRVIEGITHIGIVVSAPVLIIQFAARRQRALAMSLWATFFGLAFALAGWVAPPMVASWGLGSLFLAHAIMLAVLGVAVLFTLPRVSGDAPLPEQAHLGFVRAHLLAYRHARSVLPGLIFIFHTAMYVPLVTFVPLEVGSGAAAVLLVWMPLVSIGGTVVAGLIAQRMTSPPVLLLVGFLGVLALLVLIALVLHIELWVTLLALVMMFFSGLIQGASFGLIPTLSHDPVVSAHANGVLTQVGNVGSTLGPPVFASVLALGTGFNGMVYLVAALVAGGCLFSVLALRLVRRDALAARQPAPA